MVAGVAFENGVGGDNGEGCGDDAGLVRQFAQVGFDFGRAGCR